MHILFVLDYNILITQMDNTMTRKGKMKNCRKHKGDYMYGGKRVRQVEGFAEKNNSKIDKNNKKKDKKQEIKN